MVTRETAESLYDRVVAFVAEQRSVSVDSLRPETTLFGDLGTDGDDGTELLDDFAREFSVDMSECDSNRYFGPEVVSPWVLLLGHVGFPSRDTGRASAVAAD